MTDLLIGLLEWVAWVSMKAGNVTGALAIVSLLVGLTLPRWRLAVAAVSLLGLWPWRIYIATLQYAVWASLIGVWVALLVGLVAIRAPGAGTLTIAVAWWRGHDEVAVTIAAFLALFWIVKCSALWLATRAGAS